MIRSAGSAGGEPRTRRQFIASLMPCPTPAAPPISVAPTPVDAMRHERLTTSAPAPRLRSRGEVRRDGVSETGP
jgi:hypothetical protein